MTDRQPDLTLDERTKLASTAKAEADAEAARYAAEKAEADARAADAAARKAAAEAADVESPTGQQARDAKNQQAIAEAEQKAAAARQTQISALIPDLSKVKDSTLEVAKEGPALGGGALTFGALAAAAKAIARHVKGKGDNDRRILVTSDPDLASPDAAYQEVSLGLKQLAEAADELLSRTVPEDESVATAGPAAAVAALAAAVPHVLSLVSAERTLATSTVTITDLAAASAVAGAIGEAVPSAVVVHDDLRLVVPGRIATDSSALGTKRHQLVARKIELSDRKTRLDAELVAAKEQQKSAEKALADGDPKKDAYKKLHADVENARKQVLLLTRQAWAASNRFSLVESLIASIDAFVGALRVVPTDGRRSPLATAALQDQLHQGAESQFTHVLLVKAQPAQTAFLTDDRSLFFKDKFSTLVEVNVTYMLMATSDSHLECAGTASATASAHGELGSRIEVTEQAAVAGVWGEQLKQPERDELRGRPYST